MLTVLSPSKTLDFKSPLPTRKKSEPLFLERAAKLIANLQTLDADTIAEKMNVNQKLGTLNVERYQNWTLSLKNARPAILSFRGDVYLGLNPEAFNERDFTSAQRRLRILSGLYGILRPMDLIHPYRLEMGTSLRIADEKSLYEYWSTTIADTLNSELSVHRKPIVVNLASSEYFSPSVEQLLNYRVIKCTFLDRYQDDYRFMSYFGKKARGLLARHIVMNRSETISGIKAFNADGYYFSPDRSTKDCLVFLRDNRPMDASS
ncbi:MAG: peroxide stress protein YaaA [Gammaproteobacteria bacterium]|nr:peroxide stress protein YaaA [Gammaproteobacteria bacterium]MDE0094323.1 peroxide stress protein YaaA [Gammaproteobacteria bacterium]MDE0251685.1 peroxide stress protein YaaA [Gammaproteobacteria bacterium]MDE0403306.1 peroxide stress protein YaaA [Gammaproteobacteria bacterium]MXX95860.1 peroxide stress protein YaaA [Gammaproteobacteria bacterium]